MLDGYVQFNELNSFKLGNSLLKSDPMISFGDAFEEALEQAKDVSKSAKDKANEVTETENKKKAKESDTLPDITKITRDSERGAFSEANTYKLLEKFKDKSKSLDDNFQKGPRQQLMENANFAGQAMFQPVADQGKGKATKSQMLAAWDKYAPTVTEDITKRSVRIDIPLINDVQAIVLRMHPDKSITASMLGSYEMGELLKQNKDKLDRNLRHHHLSLREFNTYRSELEFTNESGARKSKKKQKSSKPVMDIV